MQAGTLPDLVAVVPELFLASAGMLLLMLGVFRGEGSNRLVSWLAVASLAFTAILVLAGPVGRTVTLNGLFIVDPFAVFMKILSLAGAALAIIMAIAYNEQEGFARFEYSIIALFATLGMMLMISANDLMSLYLGLELQSLSLYVLAAFRRDSVRSTEAGLKYFVLGALSSGMLLYGASMIYGFAGTTSFDGLAGLFGGMAGTKPSIGVIIGIVFLAAGLAFKVSAVPFHMWTPDVYEGSPTPVTAFFAVAPKVAALALFVRVMVGPFGHLIAEWQQIVVVISILSMALGAVAAIAQTNIKRLMAYSSIGHMGFALVGLAAGSADGVRGVLVYVALYLFMNVGTFACILAMRRGDRMVEEIGDLAGLSTTRPAMAMALAVFMFSMAGIPPMAGFFAKLYVFMAAIDAGLITLAVLGVLSSVVGAYYYIRIVKIMYFDEAVEPFQPMSRELGLIVTVTGLVTLLFFLYPMPIVGMADVAASLLFTGG
jgi:NADH-quinone oxidoreductase subunit N